MGRRRPKEEMITELVQVLRDFRIFMCEPIPKSVKRKDIHGWVAKYKESIPLKGWLVRGILASDLVRVNTNRTYAWAMGFVTRKEAEHIYNVIKSLKAGKTVVNVVPDTSESTDSPYTQQKNLEVEKSEEFESNLSMTDKYEYVLRHLKGTHALSLSQLDIFCAVFERNLYYECKEELHLTTVEYYKHLLIDIVSILHKDISSGNVDYTLLVRTLDMLLEVVDLCNSLHEYKDALDVSEVSVKIFGVAVYSKTMIS